MKYDYELPPFSLSKVVRVVEYQGLETPHWHTSPHKVLSRQVLYALSAQLKGLELR